MRMEILQPTEVLQDTILHQYTQEVIFVVRPEGSASGTTYLCFYYGSHFHICCTRCGDGSVGNVDKDRLPHSWRLGTVYRDQRLVLSDLSREVEDVLYLLRSMSNIAPSNIHVRKGLVAALWSVVC